MGSRGIYIKLLLKCIILNEISCKKSFYTGGNEFFLPGYTMLEVVM